MAHYGPPESNRSEALGITALIAGLVLWVAGLAYAAPSLQVVLVIVGVGLDLLAGVILFAARRAGDAARAGR